MIQRIQTVYLAISTLLIGLLFFMPFATITKDGVIYSFNMNGILLDGAVKQSGIMVMILITICLAFHVFAITSFRKRLMQVRVIIFSVLLLMALLGSFLYYTYFSFSGAQISYKITLVFPLLAIILDYLAIRGIKKDEALIRSIDRIR